MNEDEIVKYLSRGQSKPPKPTQRNPRRVPVHPAQAAMRPRQKKPQESFKDFSATQLFCPTCQRPSPVREKVMLYLPTGAMYEYKCTQCGTSLCTRKT